MEIKNISHPNLKSNIWIQLIIALLVSIANGYLFNWLNTFFHFQINQDNLNQMTIKEKIAVILVLAPALETIVFQSIPIELSLYLFKKKWIAVMLSATCFSLIHHYNPIYMAMTFCGGLILGIFYLFCYRVGKFPMIYVTLLHSLYNLYGFLFVK